MNSMQQILISTQLYNLTHILVCLNVCVCICEYDRGMCVFGCVCVKRVLRVLTSARIVLHKEFIQSDPPASDSNHYCRTKDSHEA